jgi:glycosyltransferase involved in cell wall biosynthesis
MRVLQVHNRYRSAAPSGENRVVDIEGAALRDLGHEVARFERFSDDIESWSRLRKATMPAKVVWSQESRRELGAQLRAWRPDVVHVHNTFPLLSSSVLYACRDAAVPVVATLHNYKLACASGDFFRQGTVCHDCAHGPPTPAVLHGCYRNSRLATAPLALATALHRSAWRSLVSAYILISKSQASLLGGLQLPAGRVFIRDNLIPRRSVPAATSEPMLVYASRLDETKGARLLMAGWDRYLSTEPGAGTRLRLAIAGAGPLSAEVAAWAASRPSVQLLGQLDAAACASLVARSAAVLVPSAWEETFGLVVVEAMALGVPPIAAGHGSLPELVTAGVDGTLFRPGDPEALAAAISDVAGNPARYKGYGDQARQTYERRFNPERSLRELVGIYEYAVANPATAGAESGGRADGRGRE